jgi:flagellar basal-body rod modification protein FlgD
MSVSSTTATSQKTLQQIIDAGVKSTSDRNTGELGKTDFLNLLVTQLRYQDPLNPSDDKEFIGQMAQFSALEQMQNLNNSFSSSKAFSLIGKNITASIVDDKTKETTEVNGDVTNVKMSQGKIYVVVKGEDIPVESITDVTEGLRSSQSNISAYTNLIGYNVDGIAYDSDTGDMLKVSGNVKSIQKGVYEDYAVMDGVNAEIAEIVTDVKSTDPDFIKDTLNDACKDGKEISIVIVDRATGKKVPVTVKLASVDFTGDKITAVLNSVHVPVEGITNITKPVEKTASQPDTAQQAGDSSGS